MQTEQVHQSKMTILNESRIKSGTVEKHRKVYSVRVLEDTLEGSQSEPISTETLKQIEGMPFHSPNEKECKRIIEVMCTSNQLCDVDKWFKYLRLAPDCQSQNIQLTRTQDGQRVLNTIKKIPRGDQLLLWFSDDVIAELEIPFLTPANITGLSYTCHHCLSTFLSPNPLKIHMALKCGKHSLGDLMLQLVNHPSPLTPDLPLNLTNYEETNNNFSWKHLHNYLTQNKTVKLPITPASSMGKEAPPRPNSQPTRRLLPKLPFERRASEGVKPLRIAIPNEVTKYAKKCSTNLLCTVNKAPPKMEPSPEATVSSTTQIGSKVSAFSPLKQRSILPTPRGQSKPFLNFDLFNSLPYTPFLIASPYIFPTPSVPMMNSILSASAPALTPGQDVTPASEVEAVMSNWGRTKQGHVCYYCGKVYSRKYGLKIHIRTHTGYKPLQCKVCLRPFGDPSNLNKHVRLHAQGSTPYKCVQCNKILVRRRDLERHLRSRHPEQTIETGGIPIKQSPQSN